MNRLVLFAAGLLLGFLYGSRQRPQALIHFAVDVEELASPSIYRRTLRLRSHPVSPVPKGAPQTAC